MKTLIDIQDDVMKELLKESKAKTKKAAVTLAIREYISMRRREKLLSMMGNYDFGYTQEDLEKMRADD
ncbi:MAG: type II toxin-antitoxin system VapB family antitoxin [Chloroflexi bacterium]|nr:type II toxin-antitoxin system VapB family antitoxin [Chloroflexota bacterium]